MLRFIRGRWSAGAPGPRRRWPVEQVAPGVKVGIVLLLLSCLIGDGSRLRVRVSRLGFESGCKVAFTRGV
jgi:hypothetical protein